MSEHPLNVWMRERRIQKFPEFKYESFIWGWGIKINAILNELHNHLKNSLIKSLCKKRRKKNTSFPGRIHFYHWAFLSLWKECGHNWETVAKLELWISKCPYKASECYTHAYMGIQMWHLSVYVLETGGTWKDEHFAVDL